MELRNLFLVLATLIISASAIPLPPADQPTEREQVSPIIVLGPVHLKDRKPIEDTSVIKPEMEAQERQDHPTNYGYELGNMLHTIVGGKKPFEAISGPYYSSSIGPAFATGPFSGLGQPLSSGPLGGIMGVPLLFLTMSG